MSKKANDALRNKYTIKLMELLQGNEDVMRTGSGTIAFPVVDDEGEDNWIKVTVQVPTGERDGTPYDGYDEADQYKTHIELKAAKAEKAAIAKAAKIERDKKIREARALAKANHEAK